MGTTTYEMPHLAPSKTHHHIHNHHPAYSSSLPQSDRYRPALNERPPPNEQVFHPSSLCSAHPPPSQPPNSYAQAQAQPPAQAQVQAPIARQPRPQVPSSQPVPQRQPSSKQPARYSTPFTDQSLVFHSMEIPERISARGGNLAHFMAEVTSFFWFESSHTIEMAEKMRSFPPNTPIPRLAANAIAPAAFKTWASQVVSTTQIARNVVLLALLYVYRLKKRLSSIRGGLGSEYRLLTVAMMLGNKFLDDNTYTNKTWADVTGLGVVDIHLMEVEFLSNVRYNLLASAEEWHEWLDKLASVREYMELAQRSPSPSPSPLLIPSPTHRSFERSFAASPLPSPLNSHHAYSSQQALKQSPSFGPFPGTNGATSWPSPCPAPKNAISPLALKPEHHLSRKRSFPEDDPTEPPAKRVGRILAEQQQLPHPARPAQSLPQYPQQQQVQSQKPNGLPRMTNMAPVSTVHAVLAGAEQGRLAVPNLTLNTSQTATIGTTQPFAQSVYAPAQASPLSLPPLVSGVRAMSTVYPTTTGYAPQQSLPATCAPSMVSTPQTVTPTTSFPPMTYGTPTKRLSPQHPLASSASFAASSPLVDSYGHHTGTPVGSMGTASGVHTPISHSPSIYLQHRNSPYKPVRGVNTLLIPPPAAFLQQYHYSNALTPSHLHYQPLGRRNEYRTGIVPEYTMPHLADRHPNGLPSAPYQPMHQQQQQVLPNPHQNRAQQQIPYQPHY
ncbi:hypothetical protein QBC43DRAFT_211707 [Cladorrhinum sp. PSN259]|nr:hypothetical protein QBC43DRAFT_211707 [Cladorrhinum sp. PSN259]